MTKKFFLYISILACVISSTVNAQLYPDQFYTLRINDIYSKIESSDGIKLSDDGKSIVLQDNYMTGYFILSEQTAQHYFNRGYPSWNGKVFGGNGSFKVQMRFPYGGSWSPWLTIGYWKDNIWQDYGTTTFPGGYIDIDYVRLSSYVNKWQFKVILSRPDFFSQSPSIHKLSFFVSDSRTTSNVNISQIVNDNPSAIYIDTDFIHQYSVDPVIGGDICSPTTVSMILKSYKIPVDPYQFALSTYDPYHKMFGIWPRVVQNAAEYGLDGAVTQYRNWSDAKRVLENGGRIGMSIGSPLYTGHLIMLAGFTNDGRPIVHDPAKSNGKAYIFDKTQLSQSWFNKGGIAYTFYPQGNIVSVDEPENLIAEKFELLQNYPNPFNPTTTIKFFIPNVETGYIPSLQNVTLKVYDVLGREIVTLVNETKQPGTYEVLFDGSNLVSGIYICQLQVGENIRTIKLLLAK